jgi:hypothetical protein
LRIGDKILTSEGKNSQVTHIIEIDHDESNHLLRLPGGLLITPDHPIRIKEKWTTPKHQEAQKVDDNPSRKLYSFVLEDNHIAIVNGYECLTWGHEFKDNEVANYYSRSHPLIQKILSKTGPDKIIKITQDGELKNLLNAETNIEVKHEETHKQVEESKSTNTPKKDNLELEDRGN